MSTSGDGVWAPETEVPLALETSWGIPALFGGYLAAQLLRASGSTRPHGWVPTELHAVFHRPTAPGSATALMRTLHRGRRTASTLAQCVTDGRVTATLTAGWMSRAALVTHPTSPPAGLPVPSEPATGEDLSGHIDWRAEESWPTDGSLEAWIRPRSTEWALDEDAGVLDPAWYAVAGDLLAPALMPRMPEEALRVSTVSLQVSVHALVESGWIRQSLRAERQGERATSSLELRSPAGDLLARVQQSAVLSSAPRHELPVCATALGWGRPRGNYISTSTNACIG